MKFDANVCMSQTDCIFHIILTEYKISQIKISAFLKELHFSNWSVSD